MPTVDLRCDSSLYGRLTDERWLEVRCRRRACGYVKGTVILHTIDIKTGEVVHTDRFRDPRKEGRNASHQSPAPVRAP